MGQTVDEVLRALSAMFGQDQISSVIAMAAVALGASMTWLVGQSADFLSRW